MAAFGLCVIGLLLICVAPASMIAGGLDGKAIGPLMAGCGAALLTGIVCFVAGRWMLRSPNERRPRLTLPFRRTLWLPRRDDLDELVTRYFLSLKYELKHRDHFLWSFQWTDKTGEWNAGDAKVHVSVAAFEMGDRYRLNCHMELSGEDACWATQRDLRNMARDLDGLEELVGALNSERTGAGPASTRFALLRVGSESYPS
jgi:hypothetical protein